MQLSIESITKSIINVGVFKPLLLLVYFVVAILIVLYNWLYLSMTLHAHSQIGLNSPKHIDYLVKISSLIALLTAGLAILFLAFRL